MAREVFEKMTFEELKPVLERILRPFFEQKRLREWEEKLRESAKIEIVDSGSETKQKSGK